MNFSDFPKQGGPPPLYARVAKARGWTDISEGEIAWMGVPPGGSRSTYLPRCDNSAHECLKLMMELRIALTPEMAPGKKWVASGGGYFEAMLDPMRAVCEVALKMLERA